MEPPARGLAWEFLGAASSGFPRAERIGEVADPLTVRELERSTILKFGKSTISIRAIFNSYVTNYQRVVYISVIA